MARAVPSDNNPTRLLLHTQEHSSFAAGAPALGGQAAERTLIAALPDHTRPCATACMSSTSMSRLEAALLRKDS